MSARDIRAYLRAATKDGILHGWNGPNHDGTYSISPPGRPTQRVTYGFIIGYCDGLKEIGLKPLYRESEGTLYSY